MDPTLELTQVIEVDFSGEIIGYLLMDPFEINQAIDEGRHIIMHGWSQRLFQPKYDFAIGDWVEGLSQEELNEKELEVENQKSRIPDEEMNAIAIMELAEMFMGGGS